MGSKKADPPPKPSKKPIPGMRNRDLEDEERQILLREALQNLLTTADVSSIALSEAMHRPFKTVDGWLSGTRRIKFKHFVRAASVLGQNVQLNFVSAAIPAVGSEG